MDYQRLYRVATVAITCAVAVACQPGPGIAPQGTVLSASSTRAPATERATPVRTPSVTPSASTTPTLTASPTAASTPTPSATPTVTSTPLGGGRGVLAITQGDRLALFRPDGHKLGTLAGGQPWISYNFAWSPDGRLVSFSGADKCQEPDYFAPCGLYVVLLGQGGDPLNSTTAQLVAGNIPVLGHFWLPDSQTIVYSTARGLYSVSMEGMISALWEYAEEDPFFIHKAVLAGQDSVAILAPNENPTSFGYSHNAIYLINPTTSARQALTTLDADENCSNLWGSPDGTHISFDCSISRPGGAQNSYIVRLDDMSVIMLPRRELVWQHYWSTGGLRRAFQQFNSIAANRGPLYIEALQPTPGQPTLIADVRVIRDFLWSPDGNALALVSHNPDRVHTDAPVLILALSDGSRVEQIDQLPVGNIGLNRSGLAWSADNQYFFYTKLEDDAFAVYQVTLSDWTVQRVFELPTEFPVFAMRWQP
jgi:Tol biopolymer transport system component